MRATLSATSFLRCAALAAAVTSACSSGPEHVGFAPTENVAGRTVEGFKEAIYELSVAGQARGEVKVWSRGAERVGTQQGERTALHIGLTIENSGQTSLQAGDEPAIEGGDEPPVGTGQRTPIEVAIDQTMIESLQAKTASHSPLAVTAVIGNPVVPPGTVGTVELQFLLPPGIQPEDIVAFRVRWALRLAGQEFLEFTPFVAQRDVGYAYVPVYGYYHPYSPWDYPFYDPYFTWYGPSRVYTRPHVIIVQPYPRRITVPARRR